MNTTESVFSLSNININIKYALSAEHDNTWYEVKAKAEYAFWIIQKGSLTIEYAQNTYALSEGDVFFFILRFSTMPHHQITAALFLFILTQF